MANILIVDDYEDTLELLAMVLSVTDHRCVFARSGPEAIARYEAAKDAGTPFDLIVLDMFMPDMTGCQVADYILRSAQDRSVRILFLSAYKEDPATKACAERTGADVCTKPDDVLRLPVIVDKALCSPAPVPALC